MKKLLIILILAESLGAQSVFDRKLASVLVVDVATMIADARLSATRISPRDSTCVEADPLFGLRPSPTRYYVQMSLTTLGIGILAYELKRHGHLRLALAAPLIEAGLHGAGIGLTLANGCHRSLIPACGKLVDCRPSALQPLR